MRAGVLVVDGFGIVLRVLYGRLHVQDGIGRQRRSIVLDRAGSGLERLALIGKQGSVSLEALSWLRAIGAAFVQIGNGGEVHAHSVPFGYDGLPIRRAQALAVRLLSKIRFHKVGSHVWLHVLHKLGKPKGYRRSDSADQYRLNRRY